MHRFDPLDVLVLGAGIQGVCSALELSARGHRVALIDAADDVITRTSLRQEGKVHLGFVYANDPTCRTPGLMLEGALKFGELIERWTDANVPWPSLRSRPFTYVVLEESMVSSSELIASYEDLQARFETTGGERPYLGSTQRRLWRAKDVRQLPPVLNTDRVQAAFETAEVALDVEHLRRILRVALQAKPRIQVHCGHVVTDAERRPHGFRVSGRTTNGDLWVADAGAVINCLWESRIGIDAQLGISPNRPWVHRLKYRVLGRLPESLIDIPSFTFVLGPFGDIVVHPGRPSYISWYPACVGGWESSSLDLPAAWSGACSGQPDPRLASAIATETLTGLAQFLPELARFGVEQVDAGAIFAWGSTDIDDPQSELHARYDIGIARHDGWYSINTGKFTTAPLFAERLGALVGDPS